MALIRKTCHPASNDTGRPESSYGADGPSARDEDPRLIPLPEDQRSESRINHYISLADIALGIPSNNRSGKARRGQNDFRENKERLLESHRAPGSFQFGRRKVRASRIFHLTLSR